MHSNLVLISQIQKELELIKYPDSHRVSIEVAEFLSENSNVSLKEIIKRLKTNEPWEYVRGWTEFLGSRFQVNPSVLIPRIETEQLVVDSLEYIESKKVYNIVDVGTGSGCIAISLAKLVPYSVNIYATDISKDTLEIAKQNEKNILEREMINWINTDLADSLPILSEESIVIANLPYIPTKQYLELDSSVKEYEPRLALDGGSTGVDLIKKLFDQMKAKDMEISALFLETEEIVFTDTITLTREYFPGYSIEKKSDCFGRNRFVYALKKV